MIIRGVVGVIIGVAYGCVVGVVVFLLTRPDLQQHNGLIMIDSSAMAWLAVALSALVAGACAVLTGLIIAIARLGKAKAAITGFVIGLLPLVLASIAFGPPGVPSSAHDWIDLFVRMGIPPTGVALTGVVQAVAIHRL